MIQLILSTEDGSHYVQSISYVQTEQRRGVKINIFLSNIKTQLPQSVCVRYIL